MKNLLVGMMSLVFAGTAAAQGRANWNNFGGDAQHTGWERTDARVSKDTVKDLQLLFKMKLENQPKGARPLQPPLILGNLISYRGFKELAFVATSSDVVYGVDADLGKMFWQKHLEYANLDPPINASSWACPGGLTAMPAMPPPAARGGGAPARGPVAPDAAARGGTPAAQPPQPAQPARGPFTPAGGATVYAISSDGRLHRLNTSTGDDVVQPVGVLPANAKVQSLTIAANVIYTVTGQDCNGVPNAIWAIDLTADPPKATSFPLKDGDAWALGGPSIGADGTVYVQTSDRLLMLAPKDLFLKQAFETGRATKKDPDLNIASPLAFSLKERELVVATGRDGRLSLLDASTAKSLYQTPPVASATGGIWGGLSSWEDADGNRWVLVPVWGAVNPELKAAGANGTSQNGSAPNGSIVAFKVEEQNGGPVLTPVWVSRDMSSPEPPAIASGVVFALSSGEFTRQTKTSGEVEEHAKSGTRATLYALDAVTGKELYSSRNLIAGPAALTGIALANGRVYFGTMDGTLYAFGMYLEH